MVTSRDDALMRQISKHKGKNKVTGFIFTVWYNKVTFRLKQESILVNKNYSKTFGINTREITNQQQESDISHLCCHTADRNMT